MHPSVRDVLRAAHEADADFAALLNLARTNRVRVALVLPHVGFDSYSALHQSPDSGDLELVLDDWSDGNSWPDLLVDHMGGPEAAQAVLDEAGGWMARHSIEVWQAKPVAQAQLTRGLSLPEQPTHLRDAVEFARGVDSYAEANCAIEHALGTWPMGVLAMQDWIPEGVQHQVLPKRAPLHVLLDQAYEQVGADATVSWWTRVFGQAEARASNLHATAEYLRVAARLRKAEALSVSGTFARLAHLVEPSVWVPIGQDSGLQASHCLLTLKDQGVHWVDGARTMLISGYSNDEIMWACTENGLGQEPTLRLLQAAGWHPADLAASMVSNGSLLAEVRELLKELGLRGQALSTALSGADCCTLESTERGPVARIMTDP